jgi:hypothetical protein
MNFKNLVEIYIFRGSQTGIKVIFDLLIIVCSLLTAVVAGNLNFNTIRTKEYQIIVKAGRLDHT